MFYSIPAGNPNLDRKETSTLHISHFLDASPGDARLPAFSNIRQHLYHQIPSLQLTSIHGDVICCVWKLNDSAYIESKYSILLPGVLGLYCTEADIQATYRILYSIYFLSGQLLNSKIPTSKQQFIRAKNKTKSSTIQPRFREDIPPLKLSGLRAGAVRAKSFHRIS